LNTHYDIPVVQTGIDVWIHCMDKRNFPLYQDRTITSISLTFMVEFILSRNMGLGDENMAKPSSYPWESFFGKHESPLMAFLWKPQEDKDHVAHGHTFLEVVVCTKGQVMHRTSRGLTPMQKGDVAVLRPGSWHEFVDAQEAEIYNLCFKEELLHHELLEIPRDSMTHYLLWDAPRESKNRGIFQFRLPPELLRELRAPLAMLNRIYQDDWPGYNTQKLGGLMICLGVLARGAWANRTASPSQPGVRMHSSVKRVLTMIQGDLAYPWTLEELARRVRMNHSYLARVFRQAMRCTVLEYISSRRAETAAALLITTENTISAVAQQVGWDDPNYFARCFRKHFGVSASDYRKQHRTHVSSLTTHNS